MALCYNISHAKTLLTMHILLATYVVNCPVYLSEESIMLVENTLLTRSVMELKKKTTVCTKLSTCISLQKCHSFPNLGMHKSHTSKANITNTVLLKWMNEQ